MERYQRMILRVQRSLRDQRRYSLNVGSVGQLNIGLMQQNVASGGTREQDERAVIEGIAVTNELEKASMADADTDTKAAAIPRRVSRSGTGKRDRSGAHGGVRGEPNYVGADRLE